MIRHMQQPWDEDFDLIPMSWNLLERRVSDCVSGPVPFVLFHQVSRPDYNVIAQCLLESSLFGYAILEFYSRRRGRKLCVRCTISVISRHLLHI